MSNPVVPEPALKVPSSLRQRGHVVLLGGANMDLIAGAMSTMTAGDSTPGKIHWAPGGVARNVAENLARLDVTSHLVSLVGDDLLGIELLRVTRNAGVDVSRVAMCAGQRTATYLSVHGPDGEVAMAMNDMAILECLTPEHLQKEIELLQSATCIVLDCNLTPAVIDWLFGQPLRAPFFADGVSVAKCARLKSWLPRIHTLKVNALEATELTGHAIRTISDAHHAALCLHRLGVHRVVISLGKQGVCWFDQRHGSGYQATRVIPAVPVVNTSGAGDALLAGLVYGHLNHLELPQAIEFAMICAEITLGCPNSNSPQLSQSVVLSLLSTLPKN